MSLLGRRIAAFAAHLAAAARELAADVAALGADIWRDVRELAAEMLTGRIPL